MSMKIHFNEEYTETTYYTGEVDDKHKFTVYVNYDSLTGKYEIDKIVWNDSVPTKKNRAVKRIKQVVYEWHKKGDLYTKDY